MTTPSDQPFTDIPASATPALQVQAWLYTRRKQVEYLASQLGPKSDFSRDTMEALGKKIRAAEGRLANGEQPASVMADFQAWVGDWNSDQGAWDYYVAWQKTQDQALQQAQAKEAGEKAVNEAKNRAAQAAIAETSKRPGGLMAADGDYGRVIAGLASVGAPATCFGISGRDMHAPSSAAVNLVIAELLKGTNQAEKWPQESCAEVDALKRYLTGAGITSAANIPRDTLVFHAEVWNPGGTWSGKKISPRWQPRAACANCKQWVGKIGALLA